MKYVILTIALMLFVAAPVMAAPPGLSGDFLYAGAKDDKKGKPVIIIEGKGGKVTKVKKPKKKK